MLKEPMTKLGRQCISSDDFLSSSFLLFFILKTEIYTEIIFSCKLIVRHQSDWFCSKVFFKFDKIENDCKSG